MDMFCCDKCGHVDVTDLAYPDGPPESKEKDKAPELICTQCQTGQWHNLFNYERYRPGFDQVINRPTGVGLG